MKNINFTNRRSKVKKFLIYLIPNIISLIVIYYIILFYITVEAHGDEWYVIGLLTFIFISGLFGIYVLFREIEKFFWSRKEKIFLSSCEMAKACTETKNESFSKKIYYLKELNGTETTEQIITKIRNRKYKEKMEENSRKSSLGGFFTGYVFNDMLRKIFKN